MRKAVHLALYGAVEHGPADELAWQLCQSAPLARLRDISLDSVPSRFVPHSVPVSRGEHSVAVGYLARLLADRERDLRPYKQTLVAAGLLHDCGSVPFSHIAEPFQWGLTRRTHEQEAAEVLAPGGTISRLLADYDVDPAEVLALITGAHPLPLISGSIDLDNVDNSIHLLVSLGEQNRYYDPLRLLHAFRMLDGEIVLDTRELPQLLGWRDARAALYRLLYDEPHLSSLATLYRALEYGFASGALDESFFALDESQALTLLRSGATAETRALIERLISWRHFPFLWQRPGHDEDERLLALYDDWELRKRFTDNLAASLGIRADEFAFHVGRMRGPKQIDLPFVGPDADAATVLFAGAPPRQQVALFAPKRHQDRLDPELIATVVDELADGLPAVAQAHSFC